MSGELTAALRRPDGLFGVVIRRRSPFERPLPAKPDDAAAPLALPEGGPYVEELVPLAELKVGGPIRKELVIRAWNDLASVEVLDADVLARLLILMIETLPDPFADCRDVRRLEFDHPPPQPRPTAAHPRAYRGTKYKPPKRPGRGPIDLRRHLGVPADEARLLGKLAPYWDAAVRIVEQQHPFGKVLGSRGAAGLRPYGLCWEPENRENIAALPPVFRRDLLWCQRAKRWERIAHIQNVYWTLNLESDSSLRRCVSLLAANPSPTWLGST